MDQTERNAGSDNRELSSLRYFLRYWVPVIVWMIVIYSASGDTQSVQRSDSLLARVLGWIHLYPSPSQLEMLRWFIRKGAHVTEYAILAALCWRALRARAGFKWSRDTALWTLAMCVAYAATDEFHQTFVKDRNGSIVDVAIDTLGATLALGLLWLWFKRRRQIKRV